MLLSVGSAVAAVVSQVPADADDATLLVCPPDDVCDADATFVAATLDGPVVPLELLFERDNAGWEGGVDTRAALAGALERAEAAAAKGRWATVRAETETARAALAAVRGDVNARTLFRLWFLDGASSVELATDRGHEYAFRQAAAIADGADVDLPPHSEAAARAWADERRKLAVGGAGTLVLDGAADTEWSVDGTPVGAGTVERRLLPGNHRVVATRAGTVRSFQADVPVLAGRSVTVTPTFDPTASATWLQARLDESFDTLQGPPALTRLLADWARRNGLARVRLVRVEDVPAPAAGAPPTYSAADPERPPAADGERVDHGDGIPSTYAEEVVAVAESRGGPRPDARRLRVVWFDPTLQRFSADAAPVVRADTLPSRLRVGLQLGYTGMMGHAHAALDLAGAWRVGPVDVEARLGLVRADAPYALYPDWDDRQLYHLAVLARWAPEWRVAPFVTAGPELYVPVAVGARVGAGAALRVERWTAALELHGAWADTGPGWGLGLGVGRAY